MALKGITKIELTNTETGEVESQIQENLITNAVSDILSTNPLGYVAHSNLLPLRDMFAGVFLLDSALEENAALTHVPSGVNIVGHAGTTTNSTDDLYRGSPNLTESVALDDGYRFVWDFSNTQGNGNIACICLTHGRSGNCGLYPKNGVKPYKTASASGKESLSAAYSDTIRYSDYMESNGESGIFTDVFNGNLMSYLISVDSVNRVAYRAGINEATKTYTIQKMQIDSFDMGVSVRDVSRMKVIETYDIDMTTFIENSNSYYWSACDGNDGYVYLISNSKTKIYIRKVDKISHEYTDTTLSPAGVQFAEYNSNKYNNSYALYGGYLHVVAYGGLAIHKISLSDISGSDITKIVSDFSMSVGCATMSFNGDICGKNWRLTNGKLSLFNIDHFSAYSSSSSSSPHSVIPIDDNYIISIVMYSSNTYMKIFTYLSYIATINNVTPVEKTTAKTMKITYTIREVANI